MTGGDTLCIERVTVGHSHVEALVRVPPGAAARTSAVPGLAAAALAALPGLGRHRCACGSARGIAAELADTETPHLLEHVALELMALAGSPRSLEGETRWDFAVDGPSVYHVRIGYDDDLVALGALREAAGIVETLLRAEPAGPAVDAAVTRLEAARRTPAGPHSD